nr:coiled-coil domain-containing protein 27 isoform X2 [Oryctolagus cuniculus]
MPWNEGLLWSVQCATPRRGPQERLERLGSGCHSALCPAFLMLPRKTSSSKRQSWESKPMAKGLMALQTMAGRDSRNLEERLCRAQRHLRLPEVVPSHPWKMSKLDLESPTSLTPAPEEQGMELSLRPGCPQFHTRATSTSQLDSATMLALPREECIGPEARRTEDPLLGGRVLDMSVDGRPLPSSKSLCELSYLWRCKESQTRSPSSSSLQAAQSPQPRRVPWYISVILEKDRRLRRLEAEIQRLSRLETQVRKKEEELLALQEEKEALRRQLKGLLRSRGPEAAPSPPRRGRPSEATLKLGRLSILKALDRDEEEPQPRTETQEESSAPPAAQEPGLEGVKEEEVPEPGPEPAELRRLRNQAGQQGAAQEKAREGEEEEEEEEGEEEEEVEEEERELTEEEEDVFRYQAYSLTDTFEEELMAQLEEYELAILEFQRELELTRSKHSLATGAITCLQRQMDFQESRMRKMHMENEALQKELRERRQQLQAMSAKFSSLREDKKHLELMGLTERDNLLLRQQVSELDSELARRGLLIAELEAKVGELQAQVDLGQNHLHRQKQLWEDLQGRNEVTRQAEQQARVALESTQARLERLRNKILQATFSVTGFKSLSTEITDGDILEALQASPGSAGRQLGPPPLGPLQAGLPPLGPLQTGDPLPAGPLQAASRLEDHHGEERLPHAAQAEGRQGAAAAAVGGRAAHQVQEDHGQVEAAPRRPRPEPRAPELNLLLAAASCFLPGTLGSRTHSAGGPSSFPGRPHTEQSPPPPPPRPPEASAQPHAAACSRWPRPFKSGTPRRDPEAGSGRAGAVGGSSLLRADRTAREGRDHRVSSTSRRRSDVRPSRRPGPPAPAASRPRASPQRCPPGCGGPGDTMGRAGTPGRPEGDGAKGLRQPPVSLGGPAALSRLGDPGSLQTRAPALPTPACPAPARPRPQVPAPAPDSVLAPPRPPQLRSRLP